MAYENLTYDVILERMMDRVLNSYPDLDSREGSIIYNALAPAAVELAIMYTELDNCRNQSFVNTATREYVLIACEQIGMDISQFNATSGVHLAKFNVEVEIGSRWNCELFNYEITEALGKDVDGNYQYYAKCETVGTEPNKLTGTLTPIDNEPTGLNMAKLVECVIEGENETSDDDVKAAYFAYVNSSKSDGNVSQYELWCDEYSGIGNYKIIPLWNGANTVKVSILSASNRAATPTLIEEVQNYFDPGVTGMGDGIAPIGAFVTVDTATEVPLNVSATVVMKNGYSDTTPIDDALVSYFSEIAYKKSQVAYMNVGAVILGVEGVESISNLLINNSTSDINLSTYQIPVLGTTNWTVGS